MDRVHLIITGNVTGVLFRSYASMEARKLSLTGWVKNVSDSVEIVAEGPKEKLEDLVDWAKVGPTYAQVDDLKVTWEKASGEFATFEISR